MAAVLAVAACQQSADPGQAARVAAASATAGSQSPGGIDPRICQAMRPSAAPHPGAAALARVAGVLDALAPKAWNAAAPDRRTGKVTGGVYINWRPGWDGATRAASNVDIKTSGQSDADAGDGGRHDPLADLAILRDIDAYLATGRSDAALNTLRCRLDPVVAAEFAAYSVERGWIYFDLIDLSELDPAGVWRQRAEEFASTLSTTYIDAGTAMVVDPVHHTYRPDYSAEVAAALVDAGVRFARPDWVAQGTAAATALVRRAADPATGLFPGELSLTAGAARDTVVDPLVRMGPAAQTLDGLLTVYDHTHDPALLAAVQRSVNTMNTPGLGLVDSAHGGYFFGIDADGNDPQEQYKETRQAWMLPLLRHLARDGGTSSVTAAAMLQVVQNDLYRPGGAGYAYRVLPDYRTYVSSQDGVKTSEDWISTEAIGIAVDALLGPLS